MWRDCWFSVGIIGAVVSCLACLNPAAIIELGAIDLGAWTGQLDAVLLPALAGVVGVIAYPYSIGRRRTS